MGPRKGPTRKKRLADMSGPQPDQRTEQWRGDPDPAKQRMYSLYVTDSIRLFTRKEHDAQGRLVDFALCQQIQHGGVWVDVMRVDCRHGTVHVHRFTMRGEDDHRQDLVSIGSRKDVAQGYKIAKTLINEKT